MNIKNTVIGIVSIAEMLSDSKIFLAIVGAGFIYVTLALGGAFSASFVLLAGAFGVIANKNSQPNAKFSLSSIKQLVIGFAAVYLVATLASELIDQPTALWQQALWVAAMIGAAIGGYKISPSLTHLVMLHFAALRGGKAHGEFMTGKADEVFEGNEDKLLAGDVLAASKARYPESKFAYIYKDIPEDLERSIVQDGRLITGEHTNHLLPRRISRGSIEAFFDADIFRSSKLMVSAIALTMLAAVSMQSSWSTIVTATRTELQQQISMSQSGRHQKPAMPKFDAWEKVDVALAENEAKKQATEVVAEAEKKINSKVSWLMAAFYVVFSIMSIAFFAALSWLVYCAVTVRAFMPVFVLKGIQSLMNRDCDEWLKLETKESVVRWKYRQEQRSMELTAFNGQIAAAERESDSPMVDIGSGTGIAKFRGSLIGYNVAQAVRMSLEDLSQNMLVFGGTGQGKTRYLLKPLMKQVITSPRTGDIKSIAMFVTDGKGVLWQDAKAIADKNAREVADEKLRIKFRVIGANENEYGVDLFGGIEPHIVSETLSECMKAVAGEGGGDSGFWQTQATMAINAATVLARVYECTDQGYQEVVKTNERIYSPVGVYNMIMSMKDPNGRMSKVMEAIDNAILADDESNPAAIAPFLTPEFDAAVQFITIDLQNYAEATFASVLSNVVVVMGGFITLPAIRTKFGAASGDKMIPIASLWGDNCMTAVNLSPVEYGAAARVANIFVKIRVYNQARRRNLENPEIGRSEKLAVFMDEMQDLITAGRGGFGETSFLNYSRSSGLFFVAATQGMPAIRGALGEATGGQKSENLVQQFRSKIFLQIEDPATVQLAQSLAGKALRSYIFKSDHNESFESMMLEQVGKFDDNLQPFDDITPEYAVSMMNGQIVERLVNGRKAVYQPDWKFNDWNYGNSNNAPAVDRIEKMKAVIWRAEDKTEQYMQQGNHEADIIRAEDLFLTGREHAFAYIQRGGHARLDMIKLATY